MEQEPNPEPRLHRFRLEFDTGVELHCNPTNTMGFLHSNEPNGDHIFVFSQDDPNEEPDGHPVFRQQLTNFDEIMGTMRRHGYTIIDSENGYLTDNDRHMYNMFIAANPHFAPKLPEYDLTPRQERIADFVAYLLLNERLTADDFRGSGDLLI